MSQYEKKPVKYYEFSNHVGTVTLGDKEYQLCDHVQKIEGIYLATVFYAEPRADGKDEQGIYYKKIGNADLAFLPLDLLEQAVPKYDDHNQTNEMKERLIRTIKELNAREYNKDQDAA